MVIFLVKVLMIYRVQKDGDPYLLYSKDQTPAGCGARQENKETEHLQKTQSR